MGSAWSSAVPASWLRSLLGLLPKRHLWCSARVLARVTVLASLGAGCTGALRGSGGCAGRVCCASRAVPGLAGAHFCRSQTSCNITASVFLWGGGEQAKQRHLAKQALPIQLYKRHLSTLVNMGEKMVSSVCNKVFQPQIAVCQWYFSLFSFRKESELIFFNLLRNYSSYLQHWISLKKIVLQPRGLFEQIVFVFFFPLLFHCISLF